MQIKNLPVCDMVNQMLLEHVAPLLDDVEQSLFEWFAINPEPVVKHFQWVDLLTLLVDLLVRVNLENTQVKMRSTSIMSQ